VSDYESDDLGFDVQSTEPQEERQVLPPGEYKCVIVASAVERYGEGKCVALRLQVAEGEHQNRLIFARHAVLHPSERCQQIGRAMVSSLARATGVLSPDRASEFLDRVVIAKVKVKPAKGEYGPSNDVSIYKPVGGDLSKPQTMTIPAPSATTDVPANPFE